MRHLGIPLAILIVLGAAAPDAQRRAGEAFPLTVDSIMRGPDLVGYPPSGLRWSGDASELYFEWRQPGEDEAATWVVGRDGGAPRRLSDEERRMAPPADGDWDQARHRLLASADGDVFIIDTVADQRIDITRTTAGESNPRWARGGTHVTFVRDNNLFVVPVGDVGNGAVMQLTDVARRESPEDQTDSQKALEAEQRKLFKWVEEQAARRERREARERAHALPRFVLDAGASVSDAALSGDGRYAYLLVSARADARRTEVERYVSESGYAEEIPSRTKVGDDQAGRRLAVLDLTTGDAVWAGLEGIIDPVAIPKPDDDDGKAADAKEKEKPAAPKAARPIRWGPLTLSPDGSRAVATVRSLDNNDRWLLLVDPASGRTTVLDHVHDEAWVRNEGPRNNISGGLGWLPDNRRVWFLAEHDGWMHLYTVDATAASPEARQLTSGAFEIDNVELSPDGTTFYIESTEEDPAERHLYAMSVDGGPRTKLTSMVGASAGAIAPDDSMFGLVYSVANKPPEIYLMANRAGAEATQVTTSTSEEWRSHTWVAPKVITYTARDGATVRARLYTPEMVGAKRNRQHSAVVFVHGAGYLQNAHKYWSSYYREYMFHHLLASKGYVVLDPDYRASAGYGRDWRTAIYRWMGGKDLEDVVDGAKYLVEQEDVDAKRVGVYGGSYGGFITLMAMFTSPDTFAAGAALRPVTDWAHYNHGYTSNILNEPQSDAEAYEKSSPIYFADGLKGALLICHGMVDTNVHFQDSVRLAQRLIELGKENWELAAYPVENHGFVEATSWADEYKRILKLFETNLRN